VPRAAAAAARPRREARGLAFAGTLVLLIENEPAIAEAMRDLLGGWKARVVAAPDAESALAALAGEVPDVILSDYHLDAGRTGLEALATLRATLGTATPAAIITADRAPEIRAAAEAAGCRLLHKPVRPGALRALLAQLLAERAERAGRSAAE
jgi:CheY-like chemotaxis protein